MWGELGWVGAENAEEETGVRVEHWKDPTAVVTILPLVQGVAETP